MFLDQVDQRYCVTCPRTDPVVSHFAQSIENFQLPGSSAFPSTLSSPFATAPRHRLAVEAEPPIWFCRRQRVQCSLLSKPCFHEFPGSSCSSQALRKCHNTNSCNREHSLQYVIDTAAAPSQKLAFLSSTSSAASIAHGISF